MSPSVVSTEMPEARKFERVVQAGETYEQFINNIEKFLTMTPDKKTDIQNEAVTLSKEHSWENRFLRAEQVLQEALRCE